MALEEGRFFKGAMTDKRYEADGMAEYISRFLSNGIWELGDNLKVSAAGGMNVNVGFGHALVCGYPYGVVDNGSGSLQLTADRGDPQPRIDRVVVRADDAAKRVYAYIKKGTQSAPVIDGNEISLAMLAVRAGATQLGASDITDERLNAVTKLGALFLRPSGTGIGIGGPAIADELQVHIPLRLRNAVYINGTSLLDSIYPVGSVYISTAYASPAVFFGGVWTNIADRFLLASGVYQAGTRGGVPAVALSQSQLPNFSMPVIMPGTMGRASQRIWGDFLGGGSEDLAVTGTVSGISDKANSAYVLSGGSGQTHENMPPYLVVYMWQRTA